MKKACFVQFRRLGWLFQLVAHSTLTVISSVMVGALLSRGFILRHFPSGTTWVLVPCWVGSFDQRRRTFCYSFALRSATTNNFLNLLADMLLEQGPVISFKDNLAAYGLIKHDLITRGARHINVRFNSVQEVERLKITDFRQCTTDEQLADLTTKALDPSKLARNLAALSFISLVQFRSIHGA